jgi:hypothetical protein
MAELKKLKKKISILYMVIAALMVLIIGMLGQSAYTQHITTLQQSAYQSGYIRGVAESTSSIVQQTRECGPATIIIGNQSFQFIDIVCLQQILSNQSRG